MNDFMKLGVAIVLLTAVVASPASAQSGLERVESLTRLGRAEEARVALIEWWDGDRDDASRSELQRGLWLRGRLTVDPVQAELDFQRLAVLYPSGQFASGAVLRLAQAAFARGDEAVARGYVATLVRDYPNSDEREEGEAWLASPGPLPPPGDTPRRAVEALSGLSSGEEGSEPARTGAATEDDSPARAPQEEISTGNDGASSPSDDGEDGAGVSEPIMNYYVQLGAFTDEVRAIALFEEVREAAVDVRVVRVEGSRFTHVRVGKFADREKAVEQLDALAAAGISAALVRDDRAERPIGD